MRSAHTESLVYEGGIAAGRGMQSIRQVLQTVFH